MPLMRKEPGINQCFRRVFWLLVSILLLHSSRAIGQSLKPTSSYAGLPHQLEELVNTSAVSGYETQLADKIRERLKELHPVTDNLGNVIITIGSGAPHRLIVTPIDEPGFVVSEVTADGYLRVQRLPQNGLPPIFNEMYPAQPVRIETAAGKWIDGVVAGLSVHLQPGRSNFPKAADLENFYVDIGTGSAAEARKAGVDLLDPVVINRRLMNLATTELAGASVGDRFGAAALLEVLSHVDSRENQRHSHRRLRRATAHRRARPAAHPHANASRRIYLRRTPAPRRPHTGNGDAASRATPRTGRRCAGRRAANRRLAPGICNRTQRACRRQQNSSRIRLFRKYSSQELSAAAAIPREMGAPRYCYFISRHPC